MNENVTDVLDGFEPETDYVYASTGARLVNYIVDFISFCVLSALLKFVYIWYSGLPMELPNPYLWLAILLPAGWVEWLLFGGYCGLLEAMTGGRSIGKLVTGTVALKEDGSRIGNKEAMLRGLCRMIPFEPLSMLGGATWHDKLTKTLVAKMR